MDQEKCSLVVAGAGAVERPSSVIPYPANAMRIFAQFYPSDITSLMHLNVHLDWFEVH
jgi:hypothetical protein